MANSVDFNDVEVIFVPFPFFTIDKAEPLEKKLEELGEKVKIAGILEIAAGIHDPESKKLVSGTQIILDGRIDNFNNYQEVERFLAEHYKGSYICNGAWHPPKS